MQLRALKEGGRVQWRGRGGSKLEDREEVRKNKSKGPKKLKCNFKI